MRSHRSGRARSLYLQDSLWDRLEDYVERRVMRGDRLPDGRPISLSPTVAEAIVFFLDAQEKAEAEKPKPLRK